RQATRGTVSAARRWRVSDVLASAVRAGAGFAAEGWNCRRSRRSARRSGAQIPWSIALIVDAVPQSRRVESEIVDRVAEAVPMVAGAPTRNLARAVALGPRVVLFHRHLVRHPHGVHEMAANVADRRAARAGAD